MCPILTCVQTSYGCFYRPLKQNEIQKVAKGSQESTKPERRGQGLFLHKYPSQERITMVLQPRERNSLEKYWKIEE